jgi:formylglycine-generating enzyme required for sulfatase activity
MIAVMCTGAFAQEGIVVQDSIHTPNHAAIEAAMPPMMAPASVASYDPRANMIRVEGREINWTMGRREQQPSEVSKRCGSFYIDRTEVTNQDFALFLSAKDSNALFYDPRMDIVKASERLYQSKLGEERYPVSYVNWLGAYAFANWAGKSLPTEEEWIAAALDSRSIADIDSLYPWGTETPNEMRGNFLTSVRFPGKLAVDSFPTGGTASGIADLAGNVAEWTLTEVSHNLSAGDSHSWMVVKGGSFLDPAQNVSIANRVLRDRNERLSSLGFRCIVRDQATK